MRAAVVASAASASWQLCWPQQSDGGSARAEPYGRRHDRLCRVGRRFRVRTSTPESTPAPEEPRSRRPGRLSAWLNHTDCRETPAHRGSGWTRPGTRWSGREDDHVPLPRPIFNPGKLGVTVVRASGPARVPSASCSGGALGWGRDARSNAGRDGDRPRTGRRAASDLRRRAMHGEIESVGGGAGAGLLRPCRTSSPTGPSRRRPSRRPSSCRSRGRSRSSRSRSL